MAHAGAGSSIANEAMGNIESAIGSELTLANGSAITTDSENTNVNFDQLLTAIVESQADKLACIRSIEKLVEYYQSNPNSVSFKSMRESILAILIGFVVNRESDPDVRKSALYAIKDLFENKPIYYPLLRKSIYWHHVVLKDEDSRLKSFLEKIYPSYIDLVSSLTALKDLDKEGRVLSEDEILLIDRYVDFLEADDYFIPAQRLCLLEVLSKYIFANKLATQDQLSKILATLPMLYKEKMMIHINQNIILIAVSRIIKSNNSLQNAAFELMQAAIIDFISFQYSFSPSVLDLLKACADNNFTVTESIIEKRILSDWINWARNYPSVRDSDLFKNVQKLESEFIANCNHLIEEFRKFFAISHTASIDSLINIIAKGGRFDGIELVAYEDHCHKYNFHKEQEECFKYRYSQAIERLAMLIEHADETNFRLLLNNIATLSPALVSCYNEMLDKATNNHTQNVINLLRILNALTIKHPEIYSLLSEADITSGYLLRLSNTTSPAIATSVIQFLNAKKAYFAQAFLSGDAAMPVNKRVERIKSLITLCMQDDEECTFFADLASALMLCAANSEDDNTVRTLALQAFALLIQNNLPTHFEMLSLWQVQLRACAVHEHEALREAALKILRIFDDEFIRVHTINLCLTADCNQALMIENTNKIPDLIDLIFNQKTESSLKVLALDTLYLFAVHPENQTYLIRLIPELGSLAESKDNLLSIKACALLSLLDAQEKAKYGYGLPFLEGVGLAYESLATSMRDTISRSAVREEADIKLATQATGGSKKIGKERNHIMAFANSIEMALLGPRSYHERIITCKGQVEVITELCLFLREIVTTDKDVTAKLEEGFRIFSSPREENDENFKNWGKYRVELFNVSKKVSQDSSGKDKQILFIKELLSFLKAMDYILDARVSIPAHARSGGSLAVVKRYHATFTDGVLKALIKLIQDHNTHHPEKSGYLGSLIFDEFMEDILARIEAIDSLTYQHSAEVRDVLIDLVNLLITICEHNESLAARLKSQYGINGALEAFRAVSVELGRNMNLAYEQLQATLKKATALSRGGIDESSIPTLTSPSLSAVGQRRPVAKDEISITEAALVLARVESEDLLKSISDLEIAESQRIIALEAFMCFYHSDQNTSVAELTGIAINLFIKYIVDESLELSIRNKVLDALMILVKANPAYYQILYRCYIQMRELMGDDEYKRAFLNDIPIPIKILLNDMLRVIEAFDDSYGEGRKLSIVEEDAIRNLVGLMKYADTPLDHRLTAIDGLCSMVFARNLGTTEQWCDTLNELTRLFESELDLTIKGNILKNAVILIRNNPSLQANAFDLIGAAYDQLKLLDFTDNAHVGFAIKIITFFAICAKDNLRVSHEMLNKYKFAIHLTKLFSLPTETHLPQAAQSLLQNLDATYSQLKQELSQILSIPSEAPFKMLIEIVKSVTYGLQMGSYRSFCKENGIDKEMREKYLEERKSIALERLYALIQTDEVRQAFLREDAGMLLMSIAGLLLTNAIDPVIEHVLKILNYLAIQNPETHLLIQKANITSDVLDELSQNTSRPLIAELAKNLLDNKLAYFIDGLIIMSQDAATNDKRFARIHKLIDMCEQDEEEYIYFANLANTIPTLCVCALNPIEDVSVRAAALKALLLFVRDNAQHIEMLETVKGQLLDLVAHENLMLQEAAKKILAILSFNLVHINDMKDHIIREPTSSTVEGFKNTIPVLEDIALNKHSSKDLIISALTALHLIQVVKYANSMATVRSGMNFRAGLRQLIAHTKDHDIKLAAEPLKLLLDKSVDADAEYYTLAAVITPLRDIFEAHVTSTNAELNKWLDGGLNQATVDL